MAPPHLDTLPSWAEARRVSIDIETRDPTLTTLGPGVRHGGYIVGVSFALDDGTPNCPAYYLPIRHEGGGNYHDPEQPLAYLREQARTFKGTIAGAGLGYDLDYLAEAGIVFNPHRFRDVQVSGPLLIEPKMVWRRDKDTGELFLVEEFPLMNLDEQCRRWELPGKDESKLNAWAAERGLDPKNDLWRMPAHVAADYAKQDARAVLPLLRKHERELEAQDLWAIYDIESRLLPVLVKMRRRGVRVDLNKLDMISSMALKRERKAMRELSKLSGVSITTDDTNSSAALAKCLSAEGHKIPLTPKTKKPSVKAEWLEGLGTPIAKLILEAKRWNKVRTTFCESIATRVVGDRVHCTFNQLKAEQEDGSTKGVSFGRLSSSNPNLQQQPVRDKEIGPLWRSIYIADEGRTWACLDFSSQEPRWITHYAELIANEPSCRWEPRIKDAARFAAESCRNDPTWDNHSMMAGMMYDEFSVEAYRKGSKAMELLRYKAKTTFLGLCYGMGGGKLCRSLGLPTEWVRADWADGRLVEVAGPEGQELLARFHERVPHVRALTRVAKHQARVNGYVRTLLGRRCRFPRHPQTGDVEHEHKALNKLIQGTSADQTKLAMVLADDAGIEMQLQVHDELDLSIEQPAIAVELGRIMRNAVECNVPTIVDDERGPNWGELRKAA